MCMSASTEPIRVSGNLKKSYIAENVDSFETVLNALEKSKIGFIQEKDIKQITIIDNGKIRDITKDYVGTWFDLKSKPIKYEFRGEDYYAYHNPHEVVVIRN